MAGQGQSEQSGSNKRADLRATVRKLRAARERLKQTSQQLKISKAAMEYGWGENDMPVVASRMIKALRDSLYYHARYSRLMLESEGKRDADQQILRELVFAAILIAIMFPVFLLLGSIGMCASESVCWAIPAAIVISGYAAYLYITLIRSQDYLDRMLQESDLIARFIARELDTEEIKQRTREPWRWLFVRGSRATVESEVVFLANHLEWFLKPRESYFDWMWAVQTLSWVLFPSAMLVMWVYYPTYDGAAMYLISAALLGITHGFAGFNTEMRKLILIRHIQRLFS